MVERLVSLVGEDGINDSPSIELNIIDFNIIIESFILLNSSELEDVPLIEERSGVCG